MTLQSVWFSQGKQPRAAEMLSTPRGALEAPVQEGIQAQEGGIKYLMLFECCNSTIQALEHFRSVW